MIDERHFPVVIATWMGEVTDSSVDVYYREFDRMMHRAAVEGVKLQFITDVLAVETVRDCDLRGRLVEQTRRREARLRDHVDYVMVVARRARVLGLLSFVLCRMQHGLRMSSFTDVGSALQRALQRLDGAGLDRPSWLDPAVYERPERQRAA